jgi:hypothetical protein
MAGIATNGTVPVVSVLGRWRAAIKKRRPKAAPKTSGTAVNKT